MGSQNFRVATYVPGGAVTVGDVVKATSSAVAGAGFDTGFSQNLLSGSSTVPIISALPPSTPVVGDMWIDVSVPNSPKVKVFSTLGWKESIGSGSGALPVATTANQILVSQPGTGNPWNTGNLDQGRY